jgi:sulfite exporter TauE/SafE
MLPCGLLYSALMLAALGNGVLEGAAVMALFAAGSAVSLLLAPWLWQRLRSGAGLLSQQWGTRLAGAMLALVALQALWLDLAHQIEAWCR